MRIMVVGSGGREHALVWKLSQSKAVTGLCCAPGNPGIAEIAECIPRPAGDTRGILDLARKLRADLTVVGPEAPLAGGIADLFAAEGMPVFGPVRAAARLEWSKAFAKDFMARHGVPTAAHRAFTSRQRQEAGEYITALQGRVVLKADGLAAGKGVIICDSAKDARPIVDGMLSGRSFGAAGETVVVEEYLEGIEASVFAVCDGEQYVLLSAAQDHKRALDGDRGKNTGGMGAFAPTPMVTGEILERVGREVIGPTLRGMRMEGTPYAGCLYVGLMLTAQGPKVVEYNCRFGDPETQVVLPLYDGDLAELLAAAATGGLARSAAGALQSVPAGAAVCVVLASEGYPDAFPAGRPVTGVAEAARLPGVQIFHAGTALANGGLVTAGGRVLGVTAVAADGDLRRARAMAYEAVGRISFEGMLYRRDIAVRAVGAGDGASR